MLPALPDGRLFPCWVFYTLTYLIYVRTEIHTTNFSLFHSRVRTPVLACFSRACIVLFPWELELASHGFRTRLSPESVLVRTLRSTHVPRSHIFLNFLFTIESDTPYPKSRTGPPRYILHTLSLRLILLSTTLWRILNARCILGTHSRCRLSGCNTSLVTFILFLPGTDTDTVTV